MLRVNRLGQSLSITMIIMAILGLIVLVIAGAMIVQKSQAFGKGSREVTDQKCPGEIKTLGTTCELLFGAYTDVPNDSICCKSGTVR